MSGRTTVPNGFPASRGKRRTFRGKDKTALIPPLTPRGQTYIPPHIVMPALQMGELNEFSQLGFVRTGGSALSFTQPPNLRAAAPEQFALQL